jgi:RND family efflux transporter MFP subunit
MKATEAEVSAVHAGTNRRKQRWWPLAALLAAAGGAALAAGVMKARPEAEAGATAPAQRAEVAVTVEPVTARTVRRKVAVVGSLYGRDEVTLSPKVEGRVLKIYHDVGDVVRPGDLLLEIDPVNYRLAEVEAMRALDLELAKLGLKELPTRDVDIAALPSVVRAAAQARNATARWDRAQRLSNVLSPEDRQQLETDYEVARANYRQAVLDAEVTLATARHRQATLETVRQKVRDTRVLVPAPSGTTAASSPYPTEFVVCQRMVSEGEMVYVMPSFPGATMGMFKLAVDRPLKLQVTIPERYRPEVKLGQDVELQVEAYPGERFGGTLARINPSVDRASRTFQAEVHVPNADRRLSAGSFARADILTRIDPQARTVPEEAVVSFAGVTKVFVVHDGRVREVHVRTGGSLIADGPGGRRTWVELEGAASELAPGTLAVTSGQSHLADGAAVRVREGGGR